MSNGHGRSTEGFGMSREQSAELIVRTCLANGVSDPKQIAYILATAQHETRNFTAPEEDFGRAQARKLGYRGGEEYYGRGYVHLTHKDNYERMDNALGLNGALVRDPSLAKHPEIAARILVIGMRDGMFTGKKLGTYVDADSNDLYNARRTVNGVTPNKPWSVKAARDCVTYAHAWEARVPALVEAAQRGRVAPAPGAPAGDAKRGRPLAAPATGGAAILREAEIHFLKGANRYEYGRPDMRLRNAEGNKRTDTSRTEQDLDRDGLKGVDCSSFVWRSLSDAGYDVGKSPFSTHTLFNGREVTRYARAHFDVIAGSDARKAHGTLRPGDILLFREKDGAGQHVGIFKEYDARGGIRFVGSQVSTGPAEAGAAPGSYWNGGEFEIVGALRAKPESRVRAPLHGEPPAQGRAIMPTQTRPVQAGVALNPGDDGPAVRALQRRLAELGYHGGDGKPLALTGHFGSDTMTALQAFQREHGLEGKGIFGPKTQAALCEAEKQLVTHPGHPRHALFLQVLAKVAEAEKARGMPVGPHSERVSAALAVECIRKGLDRIDRVEINRDGTLVRAVRDIPGHAESGLGATDMISLSRAATQPIIESSRQCHEAAVDAAAREQERQRLMRPAVPGLAV